MAMNANASSSMHRNKVNEAKTLAKLQEIRVELVNERYETAMNTSLEDRDSDSEGSECEGVNDKDQFCGQQDLSSFVNILFTYLVEGTKVYNDIPTGEDYKYNETFRAFPKEMAQYASILLQMMESTGSKTLKKGIDMRGGDNDSKFEAMVDVVDSLIENVDGALDEIKGKKKNPKNDKRKHMSMKHISGVLRPQLKFNPPPDNSDAPFQIKIYKDGKLTYGEPHVHYLEEEIKAFKPTPQMLVVTEEQLYKSLEDTPCTWVDTPAKLHAMIQEILECTEVAMDLEAHNYRSFLSFTCLIQISTRQEDFIVDAIELRDHLHCLKEFCHNPNIVKVMHGARFDMDWLQMDFGVYVSNLFDTGCAAKVLNYDSLGLANLLKHFCEITPNKNLQLADWRIRPLPGDMLKYAREDTHYLLYIYDRLRVLLAQQPGNIARMTALEEVFENSKELSLRRYEKPEFGPRTYLTFLSKHPNVFLTPIQTEVVKVLLEWRNTTARAEDESTGYVLPSAMLLSIAQEVPTTIPKLFRCCNPIPALVRRDGKHILDLISAASNTSTSTTSTPLTPPSKEAPSPAPSPVPCDGFAPPPTPATILSRDLQSSAASPVPSTEQLYQAAEWLEQQREAGTETPTNVESLVPTSSAAASSSGVMSFSLRSTVSNEEERAAYNPKTRASAKSEEGSALYQSLVMPSPGTMASQLTEEKIDFSRLFASIPGQSADNQAARVTTSFFSNSPSPPAHKQGSLLFQDSPVTTPTPQVPDAEDKDKAAAQMATPQMQMSTPVANKEDPNASIDTPHKEKETPPDERVPRSLNEIYSLSKQNKKRNKEKKKLKEDSVMDPSPAFASSLGPQPLALALDSPKNVSPDQTEEIQPPQITKSDSGLSQDMDVDGNEIGKDVDPSTMKDPLEFMKDIGWVNNTEAVKQMMEAAAEQPKTEPHSGGRGSGSSNGPSPSSEKGQQPVHAPFQVPKSQGQHVPQAQRPTTQHGQGGSAHGSRQLGPPQPKFNKKQQFHHTQGSGFVPYDYSHASNPFRGRK